MIKSLMPIRARPKALTRIAFSAGWPNSCGLPIDIATIGRNGRGGTVGFWWDLASWPPDASMSKILKQRRLDIGT